MKHRIAETGVVKVSVIGSISKDLEGKQLSEMGDMQRMALSLSRMTDIM